MASCRLCGYDISLDSAEKQKPCPICGESSLVSLKDDIKGMTVGIDAPLAWNKAETQQHSPWREKSQFHQGDSTKGPPSSFINPELLSLLQLVPKPQQRKAKAKREVQAAGALTPRPLVDTPPTDLNAVYIRPHADPLRHLKVSTEDIPYVITPSTFLNRGILSRFFLE